jgi:hypothetical protein
VFCYRHIFGANPTDPNKERIHEFVFPTYMKPAMNPFRVKNTFESAKMQTRFFRLYSRDKRDHLYNVSSILGWGYDLVALTGRLVSLGTARPDCTDYFLLAERPNQGPGY